MTVSWTKKEIALLVALLGLAAALRLWSIGYDLPYVFHPDEPAVVGTALRILKSGDLNPHFFHYPSLVFYVHALAYLVYYGAGHMTGTFAGPTELADLSSLILGTTLAPDPAIVMIGRLLTVVLGVGAVLLVYLIARRLTDDWAVGAVAALLTAVSPTLIYNSRIVTPDMFVTFFALLTLYFGVRIFRQGRTRHYVAIGVAIGLTAASKYNGAIVGLILPAAHFLRAGWSGWRDKRLYLPALLGGLIFLLATPYAALDYPAFSEALRFDATHYATGHSGMEGDSVRWYAIFLWSTTTLMPLLALLQLGRGILLKSKVTLLLASFPVVYFIFISRFIVRNDRTILPILPFLFLLSAVLWVETSRAARRLPDPKRRGVVSAALLLLMVVLVGFPARMSIAENVRRAGERTIPVAAEWITANIPPGSHIALESYGPYIDPDVYALEVFEQIIDNPPEWYAEQAFDYLVLSKGRYGRYLDDPERYAKEAADYKTVFASFELVKTFSSERAEIRIYALPSP
ncbi:MAG: glycosyltransferase family 39 protein [Candidatus Promineofilum sp.]|nr:glycosyltransferase family 39 protein [Promineifilum sp.]